MHAELKIPLLELFECKFPRTASLPSIDSDPEAVKHFTLTTSARRLVESNLDFAQKLASSLRRRLPPAVDLDDLLSDAYLGLMEAASTFDAEKCDCFRGYAARRIRGAMLDGIRQRNQIRRNQPSPKIHSLEAPLPPRPGLGTVCLRDILVSDDAPVGQQLELLDEAEQVLKTLTRQQRRQLTDIYLRGIEQKQIARRRGISASAVSQQMRTLRRRVAQARMQLQHN